MIRALCLALMLAAPVAADPAFDAAVLDEVNRARTQPQSVVDDLVALRASYGPEGYFRNLSGGPLWSSNEGVAAIDEAIAYMRRMKPRRPLAPGALLFAAAADHTAEQGPRGTIGHVSDGGLWPADRLRRRGGGRYVAEAISYGSGEPRDVVLQLIIDDGVPDRGHRKLLLDNGYDHGGAACGPHSRYGLMCTIELSDSADGK